MYKFKQNIDFERNVVNNFRFQNEIAFPSAGAGIDKGLVFFHSALNTFYGWDGTSWLNLGNVSGSYVLPTATTLVLGGVKIDGTTITIDGSGIISSAAGGTGLEALNEGSGVGWRLVGRDPANFGPIGLGAVDFSQSYSAGSVMGALGDASFSIGDDNKSSGYGSFSSGYLNTSSGAYAFSFGQGNTSSNYGSISFGEDNTSSGAFSYASGYLNNASGYLAYAHGWNNTVSAYSMANGTFNVVNDFYSGAVGLGLDVQSPHSFACGTGNTIYTNTSINQANTRLFIVGNSTVVGGTPNTVGTRSDAFIVFWDGRVVAPSLTTAVINAESTGKVLTTREWFTATATLATITGNGNSTTNQIYTGKVWTSNIQNNDTGNLTISGNQGLILRNYNPNDGEILFTANGLITALTDSEATWTCRFSRSYTDTLTTANNKFWGMYINDTVNMSTKTGSPYYAGIYIAPSVTGGGDIRSIYSLQGNAIFTSGHVKADDFRLNALNTAPANASDTGTTGEIRIDANHIYVCTATNTWKRVAISTW